ncbi:universal stress protein [Novispirillum sp. DQ9]|uniref:universal stress protein n=1 Tax=Novispirillum sp. DQ9 TaxID=3398612 RepID=UPI003C7DA25E
MGADDLGFSEPPRPFADGTPTTRAAARRVFLVVIDDAEEVEAALRFACRRARNTGGRVALFAATKPPEFQHWMFVGNLMQEEAREEAEERLHRHAAAVHHCSGEMPEIILREGDTRDALFELLDEDEGISVIVLAAATDERGPGPLVEALTGKHAGKLRVPVTIVPGNLSPDEIDGLT